MLPKTESCGWCVIIFMYHCLSITCLVSLYITFSNTSHCSSIDVTPSIIRRWHIVCAVCGTVWCGFERVSVCVWCVWYVVWCVCVVCVGQFGVGLGESVCSRWLCGVCISAFYECILGYL